MDLEGRVAAVTGGAHRLGKALASTLARAGCSVVVHFGRSEAAARQTVAELSRQGGEALALQADLRRPEEIDGLLGRVEERFGRLDILVNSAASFRSRPLEESDGKELELSTSVNLRAPWLLLLAALPLLRRAAERDGVPACVVNLGDLSGLYPWRGYAAHGVSKAALLHLTRVAALELAPAVRVNAIVPGAILPPPGVSEESEEWRRVGERVPLGRPGSPAHVADALRFLVGNDFVTGAEILVDGGEHLYGSTKR